MATTAFSGALESLIDPTTGQPVAGTVSGTITYEGPDTSVAQLQAAILRASANVLRAKLAANQVAVPTIAQSLPYFAQEIAMQCGAAALGVQVTGLQLAFTPAPAAPAAPTQQPMPLDPMAATKQAFDKRLQEKLDPENVEVRGQVNIGGFKVRASSKGGLDTGGLVEQAKGKAKTELIWYAGGCVIIGIVLVGLCGLGGYIFYGVRSGGSGVSPSEAQASAWNGQTPLSCGGNDSIRIEGVTAALPNDTAISAGGNCHVELVNVNITAKVGISAGANAVVTVTGGSVTGTEAAASALGSATITFSGTTVTGEKSALGGAHITGP